MLYGFALVFRDAIEIVCCHIQLPAPSRCAVTCKDTWLLEPRQCSPGKGTVLSPEVIPCKASLGPKLWSVQAGGGALDIFGMPASLGLCRHRMCIYTHIYSPLCAPAGGKKAQLMPSICALEGLSAALIQPSLFRTTGKREEFLFLAAEVCSSLSHISKH